MPIESDNCVTWMIRITIVGLFIAALAVMVDRFRTDTTPSTSSAGTCPRQGCYV